MRIILTEKQVRKILDHISLIIKILEVLKQIGNYERERK